MNSTSSTAAIDIEIDWQAIYASIDLPRAVEWWQEELDAFRPPPEMTVSQWADERRMLQAGISRRPGKWSTDYTPYLREPMDRYNDPAVRHLVLCFATQLGKTEAMLNILGFIIDMDPYGTMVVYPREDDAKLISRTRIQPMIEDCPTLRAKKPARADLYQTLEMHFAGGIVYLVGANSPAAMSSKSCRNVIRDEIGKFPLRVGDDADPFSLTDARTKSYWDIRKIIDVSSPKLETHDIWRQMQRCHEIKELHAPCPHCHTQQKLAMRNIIWDDRPEDQDRILIAKQTAHYVCHLCGGVITNDHRAWMIANSSWVKIKEAELIAERVAYWASSLYSPNLSWGDIAEAFLEADREAKERGNTGPMQDFINGWLAEPWKELVITTDEGKILAARCDLPPQTVPQSAVALTCFVDVQKYGFWFAVRAWARDYTSWLIHYGSLATWEDVYALLFQTTYPLENDPETRVRIWRAAIDTGGGKGEDGDATMTEQAYFWLRDNGIGKGCRVWATKGSSTEMAGKIKIGKPLDKTPSGKPLTGGLQIVQINTSAMKDVVHARLEAARDDNDFAAYLHSGAGADYARQILAEEKRRGKNGVHEWVRVKRDNHYLDCEVGCHVLADPEWPGGGVNLIGAARKQKGRRIISAGVM